MTGIFAQHAATYADAGLPVFPVNARKKKPAVRRWQHVTPATSRCLATNERLSRADGVGLLMGPRSGITEVDVDAVGDAWIGAMFEKFGESSVVIRTASGKAKIWYRHNGERRMIRPFDGLPIDILGSGYTLVPPSYRPDLGASYEFIRGGIANIDQLPCISSGSLECAGARAPNEVCPGGRNNHLWRWGMIEARHCDDLETLMDAMETHADAFADELHLSEIQRCARSVWKYQTEGKNFIGLKRPQITRRDVIMDNLADKPAALTLWLFFDRWHSTRESFLIAPTAMSRKGGLASWPRSRIERARDVLLERGYLVELSPPIQGKRPGRYRLKSGAERNC